METTLNQTIGKDGADSTANTWQRKTGWWIIGGFVVLYGGLSILLLLLGIEETQPFWFSVGALLTNLIACLASIFIVGPFLQTIKRSDLGFRKFKIRWVFFAVGLGLVVIIVRGLMGAVLLQLFPALNFGADELQNILVNNMSGTSQILVMLLLSSVIVPIGEELFFRGFIHKWIRQRLGMWAGVLLSSLIFAGFHLVPLQVIMVLPLGIVLAWVYEKSGSIVPAIILHVFNNLVAMGAAFIAMSL